MQTGDPALDLRLHALVDQWQAGLSETCQATLGRIADYMAVWTAIDTVRHAPTPPAAPGKSDAS